MTSAQSLKTENRLGGHLMVPTCDGKGLVCGPSLIIGEALACYFRRLCFSIGPLPGMLAPAVCLGSFGYSCSLPSVACICHCSRDLWSASCCSCISMSSSCRSQVSCRPQLVLRCFVSFALSLPSIVYASLGSSSLW